MILSKTEKERYSRHLIIDGFGEEGQQKLKQSRVLVIGAGGLGCPVIQYLVAAGVGKIGIMDGDVVSLSNLQRQILYAEDEIGQSKAEIAAAKMSKLNGIVDIHIYNRYFTDDFADALFPEYNLVVGCTDNYNSRYIIDAGSRKYNIPFVHGSIHDFEGQLCVFNYRGSCSYADVFGEHLQNLCNRLELLVPFPELSEVLWHWKQSKLVPLWELSRPTDFFCIMEWTIRFIKSLFNTKYKWRFLVPDTYCLLE